MQFHRPLGIRFPPGEELLREGLDVASCPELENRSSVYVSHMVDPAIRSQEQCMNIFWQYIMQGLGR
jgi:hypothetical protein